MKDLIESLIGIIEFLIQGSLAAAVALYLAAFFHPIPERLREYFNDLRETLSVKNPPAKPISSLVLALAFASLYFLGVVSNMVNYWFLAPVHSLVIQEVRFNPYGRQGDAAFLRQAFPLLLTRENQYRQSYYDYLSDDARWRNKQLQAHESILPSLRKYIRIIRGVVVAGYAVFFIALLKSIVGLLIAVCARWKGPPYSFAVWLFRHFVSYDAYLKKNDEVERKPMIDETMKQMFTPNVILAIIGITLFSIALLSYRTAEQEYQLLVKSGVSTLY